MRGKMAYTDNERIQHEGIDSKALFICFIKRLPLMLTLAVAGAVIGSGLNLLLALIDLASPSYVSETEYYIDFADGRLEAKDYYNDFTWNDVIATDLILGNAMELLGAGYERDAVKNMITADILSDVRYLTITVEGGDAGTVDKVGRALKASLEHFGAVMEEFDSIYQIEDLGIKKAQVRFFAWRAALLGAAVLFCAGVFVLVFRFCMGDCIYTKEDIRRYFGIPAYGLLYSDKNNADGWQEKMLAEALAAASGAAKELVFADAFDNRIAGEFARKLSGLNILDDKICVGTLDKKGGLKGQEIIIAIPFGVPCRQRTADEINQLGLLGYNVSGAVLAEADRGWTRLYFGR